MPNFPKNIQSKNHILNFFDKFKNFFLTGLTYNFGIKLKFFGFVLTKASLILDSPNSLITYMPRIMDIAVSLSPQLSIDFI